MGFVRERRAFYRILFGHHDGVAAFEREIAGAVTVMIRKRMGLERKPERFQMGEKTRRVADAGYGVHAPALEMAGSDDAIRIEKIVKLAAFQRHRKTSPWALRRAGRLVNDDGVDFAQPVRRFT